VQKQLEVDFQVIIYLHHKISVPIPLILLILYAQKMTRLYLFHPALSLPSPITMIKPFIIQQNTFGIATGNS